jgi:hypothetical protein
VTKRTIPQPYTGDKWVGSPENIAHMRALGTRKQDETCQNCYRKIKKSNMRRHVKKCYKENGDMSEAVESLARKGSTFADKKKLSDIISKTGNIQVDKYRKDVVGDSSEDKAEDQLTSWRKSEENRENLEKARSNVGRTLCDCGKWFDNRGYASHKGSGKCPANFRNEVEEVIEPFVDKVDPPIKVDTMYDDMMKIILKYVNITSIEDLNQVEEYIYEGIDMVDTMPLQKKETDSDLIG